MSRPLLRFGTDELISLAYASKHDPAILQNCLDEIQCRAKALNKGKFDEVIPWIRDQSIKLESQVAVDSSATPDQPPDNSVSIDHVEFDLQTFTRFDLNRVELDAFILLCASFVLLDKEFTDDEEEFMERLLEAEGISKDAFDSAFQSLESQNVRSVAEKQISILRNLSRSQKEQILDTLYELSLADGFLHVDEKLFLEDVNKHWGFRVVFGKGDLKWTAEQQEIIEASEDERIVVNAMPGAGKTAVACAKISELINRGIPASQIWLLSFTRTAVQELKNRIASFADEDRDVIGVKIATIDSRAWYLRFGMTDDKGKSLFQDYDLSINQALEMIKGNPGEYEQAFGEIAHVIIDEAQDITGIRLNLIDQIVQMLPISCGVTVFGDEAQAIYGFTSEEETEQDGTNYLKLLRERYKEQFAFKTLNSMHRTDNLRLQKLIDDLRLDIQVQTPADVISQKDTATKIRAAVDDSEISFKAEDLEGLDDTLILFRRRSDVLQAASFANQKDIKYRLRMGGLPVICKPWIGQLLFNENLDFISAQEFEEMWSAFGDNLLDCGDTAFSGFDRLKSVANDKGKISIKRLRDAVSRSVPPVELCIPDLGTEGPILGTIHASKGREADNVRLFVNEKENPESSDEQKAEETRILFVGASRAKQNLSVGKGYVFGGSTLDGRSFKRNRGKLKAQVEIGKEGDFDNFSVVNKTYMTNEQAIELQIKLTELLSTGPKDVEAVHNPDNNFIYDLYVVPDRIWIGRFNRQFNFDMFKIKKCINPDGNKGLIRKIPYLKLIGLKTVAIPDNQNEHPMADLLVDSAKSTGIWLVPTVVGYPSVGFW